jgi:4-amino-4-deoxy-L-arabinose transferase-like glycosyltransferase
MRMEGPRSAQPLSRRAKGALAAIVVAYVALAVLYSQVTRFRFGPDEPAHFAYVQSLALDFRLPAMPLHGEEEGYFRGGAISHQRQQPPLYYAVAALVYRALGALPADSLWRALRLFSIALGIAVMALQWRLLRLVFPEDAAVCLAGLAVLALLPMFTYITAVVNNDPMAVLLFTAVIYQWCRMLARRPDLADVAAAGVLVGLAVLSKESALALAPGLLIVAATTGPAESKTALRRIGRAGLALAIAGAVCSGWFLDNLHAYGSPTVYFFNRPAFENLREALTHPWHLLAITGLTAQRTVLFLWVPWWAVGGGRHIPPTPYTLGMLLLTAAAFIGMVLAWVDRRRGRPGLTLLQSQGLALMLMTVGVVTLGILRYVLFVDYTALQAGRYFIVVWPMMAILSVAGLSTLLVTRRAKAIGLSALVGLWLAGNAVVLWIVHLIYGTWPSGPGP